MWIIALALATTINAETATAAGRIVLDERSGIGARTSYRQQPPVPQPFPRPGGQPSTPAPQPPPAAPSPRGPATAQPDGAPTEATLGVPLYPGAQFIASYDAGRGQRYYIFGSPAPFVDLVAFYRNVLKQKGELVFDVPATHEFDIGRFREDTMAFPPGVTIKDFQTDVSQGYPNPKPNGQPARFPTIIQIVPVTER
ncbi:MAG TPA: hypothetical protein VG222_03270 [Vicinamibacterales bacterium]|nr:hypothetical protein [Vicinamibacterales bacterium]